MARGTAHFDRADHSLGRDHIEDKGSLRREPNMAKARKTNEKGASTRVKAGDAFLMPLPVGRFGFCHVFYVPVKGDNPLLRGHIMVETSASDLLICTSIRLRGVRLIRKQGEGLGNSCLTEISRRVGK
jgi:hypothetical protein